MRYAGWFVRLLGVIILFVILSRIDLTKTVSVLTSTNLFFFVLAISLVFPMVLIKALRWGQLMRAQGIEFQVKDLFLYYFVGFFIGSATPGNIGELIKVKYIADKGHSYGKSSVSVVLDRLFDVFILFFLGLLGLFLFVDIPEVQLPALSLFILLTVLLIILLFQRRLVEIILRYPYRILIPEKYKEDVKRSFLDFKKNLTLIKKITILKALILTILATFIYFVHAYLLALSINIEIPFLYLATCISIVAIVTIIPISISGLGTRDVTLVLLFSYFNISQELAIAFSILILLRYAICGLIGLAIWLKKPASTTL